MNRPTAEQAVAILRARHQAYYEDGVIYRGDPGPVYLGGQEPFTPIGGVKKRKRHSNRWQMRIKIDGKAWIFYRSHLVWAWHGNVRPEDDDEWTLDHINEDPLDDRIENLREMTRAWNTRTYLLKDGRGAARIEAMSKARWGVLQQ